MLDADCRYLFIVLMTQYTRLQLVHVLQELGVVAYFFEPADQQFHGLDGRQRVEHAAQDEDNPLKNTRISRFRTEGK
jgi:hypothetical protein